VNATILEDLFSGSAPSYQARMSLCSTSNAPSFSRVTDQAPSFGASAAWSFETSCKLEDVGYETILKLPEDRRMRDASQVRHLEPVRSERLRSGIP
jgi:hypothetical protein